MSVAVGTAVNVCLGGGRMVVDAAHYSPRVFATFARQCTDLGFDIPDFVRSDPRFAKAWTHGE